MTQRRRKLSAETSTEGRFDVLLYRIASRVMERLEQDKGLVGLREYLLPIVEDAIVEHLPGENLLPREVSALLRVIELNQGRIT